MTNRQELILSIVFGYVVGDMLGFEKSESIYIAAAISVLPMMYVIGDFFKKKDK